MCTAVRRGTGGGRAGGISNVIAAPPRARGGGSSITAHAARSAVYLLPLAKRRHGRQRGGARAAVRRAGFPNVIAAPPRARGAGSITPHAARAANQSNARRGLGSGGTRRHARSWVGGGARARGQRGGERTSLHLGHQYRTQRGWPSRETPEHPTGVTYGGRDTARCRLAATGAPATGTPDGQHPRSLAISPWRPFSTFTPATGTQFRSPAACLATCCMFGCGVVEAVEKRKAGADRCFRPSSTRAGASLLKRCADDRERSGKRRHRWGLFIFFGPSRRLQFLLDGHGTSGSPGGYSRVTVMHVRSQDRSPRHCRASDR